MHVEMENCLLGILAIIDDQACKTKTTVTMWKYRVKNALKHSRFGRPSNSIANPKF
jgi:hypothetical protein